jgi:ribonuclease Z
MKFEITILGSGSALPTLNRRPSSHFINCNERYFLIDCGEGTQLQLRKYKIKFQRIEAIFITHLHGDHFFGLVGLISSMHLLGRNQPLHIYGPEDLERLVRPQLEIGGSFLNYELVFHPLVYPEAALIYEDKLVEVHAFPLKHRLPTHGFMISEKPKLRSLNKPAFDQYGLSIADIPAIRAGEDILTPEGIRIPNHELTLPELPPRKYAYCSDTIYRPSLIEYIMDVDVLYHEATFLDKDADRAKKTYHSTAGQAGKIAREARAGKLLLGHFSSRYDNLEQHVTEAREYIDHVEAVYEGMVVRI